MNNFSFQAGTKILFGKNQIENLVEEISKYSKRILITYGKGSVIKNGLLDAVTNAMQQADVYFEELSGIQPNPRIDSVREGVKLCRDKNLGFILALGGGSVIDASKAIAAGYSYQGDPWDFCLRKAKVENPLPIGCALTIAATGSEMNGSAVITNDETEEKLPLGSELLRPKVSMEDPTYTFSVNEFQTAAGTVDIMSHIFENYFTPDKGTELQDHIAEGILKTCIQYGPVAIKDPKNYDARANLMWASSLALNGLTATGKRMGDWSTHMIEHEVSAIYDLTHGAGLSIIFPNWMKFVLNKDTAYKFARLGKNVFDIDDADEMKAAEKTIEAVRAFFTSLGMPSHLSDVEIPVDRVDEMGKKACKFGPIGYFKRLNSEMIVEILKMCK